MQNPGALSKKARRRWLIGRFLFISIAFCVLVLAPFAAFLVDFFTIVWINGFGGVPPPSSARMPEEIPLALSLIVFAALPFLFFMPLSLFIATSWKNPFRILVFRRFNERQLNSALRRVLTSRITRYGHVFTLADRSFKPSWGARVPLILGQLGFFQFRLRRIETAQALKRLAGTLQKRATLNVNWMLSWRKIFPIESTDAFWKETVTTLLSGAHLAVVDCTEQRDAVRWEIEECVRRGVTSNLLLVACAEGPNVDHNWVEREFGPDLSLGPVFTYDALGRLTDPEGFRSAAERVLEKQWDPSRDPSWRALLRSVATSVAITATVAALTWLGGLPYLSPAIAGAYSPFEWQVKSAYLIHGDALARKRLTSEFRSTTRRWLLARPNDVGWRENELLDLVAELRDASVLSAIVDNGEPLFWGATEALARLQPPGFDEIAAQWLVIGNAKCELASAYYQTHRSKVITAGLVQSLKSEEVYNCRNSQLADMLLEEIEPIHAAQLVFALKGQSRWGRAVSALGLERLQDARAVPGLLECVADELWAQQDDGLNHACTVALERMLTQLTDRMLRARPPILDLECELRSAQFVLSGARHMPGVAMMLVESMLDHLARGEVPESYVPDAIHVASQAAALFHERESETDPNAFAIQNRILLVMAKVAASRLPEYQTSIRMNLAESYLTIGRYRDAAMIARALLMESDPLIDASRYPIIFIGFAAELLQGDLVAASKLERRLKSEDPQTSRGWTFAGTRRYLERSRIESAKRQRLMEALTLAESHSESSP